MSRKTIPVDVRFVNPKFANPLPDYGTGGSAGLDLRANLSDAINILPGERSVLIPTGVSIFIKDPNYAAIILPRSGMGHKAGLVLGNGTGLIDSDYQGELMVSVCVRPGHETIRIEPGDRIAQIVVIPVAHAAFNIVESFESSARGDKGFGSTGEK